MGREVDFVVIENNKPILFIEAKVSDADTTKGLKYLKNKYPQVKSLQVHLEGKKEFMTDQGIEHTHVLNLLETLN